MKGSLFSFAGRRHEEREQERALIRDDAQQDHKDAIHDGRRHKGFSFWVAVCFTVNFIMGSGFLGVPAGFFRAGAFTGVLLMIGVTLLANITKNYIIDAMARAEAITQDQVFGSPAPEMEGGTPAPETPVPGAGSGAEGKSPPSLLLPPPRGDSAGSESQLLTHLRVARAVPRFEVTGRKFEVTELCEIFLGHRVKRAYVLLLSVYMYGALWAYSAVFASSFATFFSVTSDPYLFFALLFGTIVVTCSCLDLREQIAIQVSMSAARFIIIFLMVVTIADASRHSDEPYFVNVRPGGDHHWEWLHIGGIPYLLPVLVYSQIFHHSIPGLAQPVRDKSRVREVFTASFTVTASFYIAIGLAISIYMGGSVMEQCNLNWDGYMGANAGIASGNATAAAAAAASTARSLLSAMNKNNVGQPWGAQAVVYTVLLFPGIDVLSAYPLCAITLGSNLMSAFYGRDVAHYEKHRRYRLPFRVLASLPPVIGACFVKSLGTILDCAGLIGFGIIFFFPLLLQHYSRKVCIERWGESLGARTPYTQPRAASPRAMLALAAGSIVCFLIAFGDLVDRLAKQ